MTRETRETLATAREARTMTQAHLAKIVGVSQQAVDKWERGITTPPPAQQIRLAAVLNVPREELFPVLDAKGGEA